MSSSRTPEASSMALKPCPFESTGFLLSRGLYCHICKEFIRFHDVDEHFAEVHDCLPPKRISYGMVVGKTPVKVVLDNRSTKRSKKEP